VQDRAGKAVADQAHADRPAAPATVLQPRSAAWRSGRSGRWAIVGRSLRHVHAGAGEVRVPGTPGWSRGYWIGSVVVWLGPGWRWVGAASSGRCCRSWRWATGSAWAWMACRTHPAARPGGGLGRFARGDDARARRVPVPGSGADGPRHRRHLVPRGGTGRGWPREHEPVGWLRHGRGAATLGPGTAVTGTTASGLAGTGSGGPASSGPVASRTRWRGMSRSKSSVP
jgi:hypothetical protein